MILGRLEGLANTAVDTWAAGEHLTKPPLGLQHDLHCVVELVPTAEAESFGTGDCTVPQVSTCLMSAGV